jgi:hypothetical protein
MGAAAIEHGGAADQLSLLISDGQKHRRAAGSRALAEHAAALLHVLMLNASPSFINDK